MLHFDVVVLIFSSPKESFLAQGFSAFSPLCLLGAVNCHIIAQPVTSSLDQESLPVTEQVVCSAHFKGFSNNMYINPVAWMLLRTHPQHL